MRWILPFAESQSATMATRGTGGRSKTKPLRAESVCGPTRQRPGQRKPLRGGPTCQAQQHPGQKRKKPRTGVPSVLGCELPAELSMGSRVGPFAATAHGFSLPHLPAAAAAYSRVLMLLPHPLCFFLLCLSFSVRSTAPRALFRSVLLCRIAGKVGSFGPDRDR